jgi:tetratricopeptide (TPR) repeat protein
MRFPWSRKPDVAALNEKAMSYLQRGDTVRAEETALEAVRLAGQEQGKESAGYYQSQLTFATVHIATGRVEQSIQILQAALAGGVPADANAQKERLTLLMNLGEVLVRLERYDEAEQVLRDGLEGRRLFYGTDHPGYAFGLEPLGELLLACEKYAEALPIAEEVVENFRHSQHPRLIEGLALRAITRLAVGDAENAFSEVGDLSKPQVEEFAVAMVNKTGTLKPILARRVLLRGQEMIAERLGETHQTALNLLAYLANQEAQWGESGDAETRIETIRRAKEAYQRANRLDDVVMALQGMSLAQGDIGDKDGAEASAKEAVAVAERLGNFAIVSQAQRNLGLLLAENEKRDAAETVLKAAVQTGERSRDREMHGRSQVALGIFLQHGERLDEAKPLLEASLRQLPSNHPDAICAKSHLGAILSGDSCGCGNTAEALGEAFREFVLARVPHDLLEDLKVTITEDGPSVGVQLKREPQPEELEHLNRLLEHAAAEFRQQLQANLRR